MLIDRRKSLIIIGSLFVLVTIFLLFILSPGRPGSIKENSSDLREDAEPKITGTVHPYKAPMEPTLDDARHPGNSRFKSSTLVRSIVLNKKQSIRKQIGQGISSLGLTDKNLENSVNGAAKDLATLENIKLPFQPTSTGDDSLSLTPDELSELGADSVLLGEPDSSLKAVGLREVFENLESEPVQEQTQVSEATPTASPTPQELIDGTPKGFASLALLHPKAIDLMESQIDVISNSNAKSIFLGVLVDGTFGSNLSNLVSAVDAINRKEQRVLLVLYLTNGSTQRGYATTSISAPFVKIKPEEFRIKIQYDESTRQQFRQMVFSLTPIINSIVARNPLNEIIAIPMLEDNLDAASYFAMRGIIQAELGSKVTIMRNPCLGCYPGNDDDTLGDGRESHNPDDILLLGPRDALTLDGIGFSYPDEGADPLLLSAESVDRLAKLVEQRQLKYFGLWRSDWQGNPSSGALLSPDQRFYRPIPDKYRSFVSDLLSFPTLTQDTNEVTP